MILPARYGRLWSVAAVLVVFIIILTTFRVRSPTPSSYIPNLRFGSDSKVEPESPQEPQEFQRPPPPPPVLAPPPHQTTSRQTTSLESSSSSSSSSQAPASSSIIPDGVLPARTRTSPTAREAVTTTHLAPQATQTDELAVSASLADAANLVQPGIQPSAGPEADNLRETLADGDAVIVETAAETVATTATSTLQSSGSSSAASSSSGAASSAAAMVAGGGAVGQPGIQLDSSSAAPSASRVADGAAVIVNAEPTAASTYATSIGTEISKLIVMGRLNNEDTNWVDEELPDWQNAIYYVDLPEHATSPTGLKTKMNKAREAMPYLTYIIDNYPIFPNVVVFMHPHEKQWHNDAPGRSAVRMLQDLKLDTVIERGYVNLRCNNEVGCPVEIVPFRDPPDVERHAEQAYPWVYSHFFNATFPEMQEQIPVVGTQCCAQFAVSSAQLGKRPKEEYEKYRKYLEETEYDDDTIGRVMEYMWHIIFFQDAVNCEDTFECWCHVYGRCTQQEIEEMFDWR